jgi:hypothetical protein
MSILSAEERGDMAEQLLPVAAHLVALVHGDGGPRDVHQALARLDAGQKEALLVVLAGLVDPDQPMGRALGWLDRNEYGQTIVPPWGERATVRDLAVDDEDLGEDLVDEVAVQRFVSGLPVQVTDPEFLAAMGQLVPAGYSARDVDHLRRDPMGTTEKRVNRLRKHYQRNGLVFPKWERPGERQLTEAEVVAIRERSAAGATDVEVGMSFDLLPSTVAAICRGKRYPQFGGPVRSPRVNKPGRASRTVWGTSTPGFLGSNDDTKEIAA